MKVYKEELVPEHTRKYHVETLCDLCNEEFDTGRGFTVGETEVRCKTGDSFPECGKGTEIEVDICPECFKWKLVPWLKEQGAKVTETEWDY